MEEKVISVNRVATHEYFILDRLEAGIVLEGSEVKSLRLGNANLKDCFCVIHNGELILKNILLQEKHHLLKSIVPKASFLYPEKVLQK